LEAVEAFGDALRVRPSRLDVLTEKFTSRDSFPFEILRNGLKVLLTLASWGAKKEDTTHLVHLNFLEKEFKRLIRACNNKLLEQILE